MSTVGDISLINVAIFQFGNEAIRQWGNGTRMTRMECMDADFFWICIAKGDGNRLVCAIIFSYFNSSLPRLCHVDGRRHLID